MKPATSRKTVQSSGDSAELRVVTVKPNMRSIYFKNNGLFAENYLLNRLPNEQGDSFVMQHWETESLPEFNECYEWMLSTWEEYKDILPTLSEAQLEAKWIRPIFEKLGWTYEVQERLEKRGKTQIPDYSLFGSHESYKKAKGCSNNQKYFEYVEAIADAKAMGINLDGTGRTNSNPSYQIVRYLEDTECTWGILTDGEYWRLYTTRSKAKYFTFYEVNIRKFLAGRNDSARDDEGFKYFFNFFRRAAFANKDAAGKRFVDVVFESGERYARAVETQLKDRAFKIVELIARGFSKSAGPKWDSKVIYEHSLYYLFRLLFVLNCESKGLLNVNDLSDYFPHSLRALSARLKEEFERNVQWSSSARNYASIASLFDLLQGGDKAIGVHGFGSDMFESGRAEFFSACKIEDQHLNRALVELSCAYSEDGELQFIDYAKLGADHLGSIFEGLLEYELGVAEKDLYFDADGKPSEGKNSKAGKSKATECIKKGDFFLRASSGDRKKSGSYYTPDYVVDYIVRKSLKPLCKVGKAEDLLRIKVCDPAMGSGHFLLGALRYLEDKMLELLYKDGDKTESFDPNEIRWSLLHNCIFGVDLNPLAVELAKYSLWIYSARAGFALEPLSDQLKCGDAIIDDAAISKRAFNWKREFSDVFKSGGFDAILGNPPYLRLTKNNIGGQLMEYYEEKYPTLRSGGSKNLYQPFIERSLELKPKVFSFIVPEALLTTSSNTESRLHILKAMRLKTIGVFDQFVFGDANIGSAIFVLVAGDKQKTVEVEKVKPDGAEAVCSLEPSVLETKPWISTGDPAETAVLDKVDLGSTPLEQLGTIWKGMVVKDRDSVLRETAKKGCYPFLLGSSMKRNCIKYKYYANYDDLQIIGGTKDLAKHLDCPRILIRRTGDTLCVALSTEPELVESTLYSLTSDKVELPVLLAILNSKVLDFYLKKRLLTNQQGYPQVLMGQLHQLPIKIPKGAVAQKLAKIAMALQGEEDERVINRGLAEIDELVFSLYGLDATDREVIERSFEQRDGGAGKLKKSA